MTDELYDDFAKERSQMAEVFTYLQLKDSASRAYTADDALNLANMSRLYVDPSPEVAAAVAAARIDWDDPLLADINMADKVEQEGGFWDKVGGGLTGGIRATARGAGAVVEGVWEEGFSRPMRTGIRAYQDDSDQSIVRSWREAGASDLAIAAGEMSESRPVNWGTGYIPSSELAHEQPGFGQELARNTQELTEQGMDPNAALQQSQTQQADAFYGVAGKPITYTGQAARESTFVSSTRGGRTYRTPFSVGRAVAVQVSDPQTQMFNMLSGSIDAAVRIGWDPLNVPADEIGKAAMARNLIIPVDDIAEVGLVSGKRPWVRGRTANEWFQTGRGRRLVEYLTESESINDISKVAGDLPMATRRKIRTANTPEAVQNIMRPYMGTVMEEAPTLGARRVLGDRVFGSSDGVTHKTPDFISKWARKWSAESGDRMVSAYNIDGSFDTFRNGLDTMGASVDDTERVLLKVAMAENDPKKLHQAYGEYIEVMAKRVEEIGYDAEQATTIMNDFLQEQVDSQIYLHDQAGHPVMVEGADFYKITGPDGTEFEFPISGAHLDSEFAEHTLVMPNMGDIRRATSETRAARALGMEATGAGPFKTPAAINGEITRRLGWSSETLKGAQRGAFTQGLDKYQSIWRDFALARGGWTFRVIAEEAIRRRAAGYSRMVDMDPASIFMRQLDPSTRLTDIHGNVLDDFFKEKGLGASGFNRDINNEVIGSLFDRSKQAWETVPTTVTQADGSIQWTSKGQAGLAGEYRQLWGSEAGRVVAEMGVEKARKFFDTPQGKDILGDIQKRSGGGVTSKLDDPAYLDRWLESVDARIAEMTGGDFVYRNLDDQGNLTNEWLNSRGTKWEDNPYEWTSRRIDKELRERKVAGRSAGNTAQRRDLLLEEMGLPSSKDFGDSQFVVVRTGKDDLRRVISGEDGKFHPDMTPEDMAAFEQMLPDMFDDDYLPPMHVKSASPELERRLTSAYKPFMNKVFSTIMEKPTMAINRSPFARTVYVEEMSRFSLWADGPTRAKITKWAEKNDMLDELRLAQQKHMDALGIKKMPKVDTPFTSFEEMDKLAKAKAIDDSKALFYDLAQKGNWDDASRFIAPFADAWWEVISRWGQMLAPTNSMGGVGQAFRNWERARQGAQEVTRQINQPGNKGWFGEDQYGNRVFNYPGQGLLTPLIGENFRSSMQLESMMFVDPSSPRGLMMPGFGPYMQFPAQMVTPMVEKFFGQHAADEMSAFFFEDFAPEDLSSTEGLIEPFLPTFVRRIFDATLSDRYARVYGDEIVGTYSALLIHENNQFTDKTDDDSKRTMKQAEETGQQLAYSRILESLLPTPASPQHEAGVYIDMLNSENELWLSMAAIGDELKNAEELFGDDMVARQYVMEQFGFDPLNVTTKTRGIYARPFGEESYQKLKDNPELQENFNFTLMAFIPEGDNPEFFGPGWKDQFTGDDAAREKVTPEMGRQMISRQKGQMAYEQLTNVYDEALYQAEGIYGKDTNGYRQYRDGLDLWKYESSMDISTEYFAWGADKEIAGATQRPTYESLHDEIMNVTQLKSDARRVAEDLNPELVVFLDRVAEIEDQAEQASLAAGHKYDWWRSAGGGMENRGEKRRIHEWYIANIEGAKDEMMDDGSRMSANWMLQRIFVPLLDDVEFKDTVVFPPIEPPVPQRDYVGEDQRRPTTQEYAESGGS